MKKLVVLSIILCCFFCAFAQNKDAKSDPKSAKKVAKPSTKYLEYTKKGTNLAQDGDFKAALKEFDKALKENPEYLQAYFNRGLVKIKLMDYQGAIEDFNQVLKLRANFSPALLNRAAAKGYLKDYAAALSDLDQLLEAKPSYAKAYALRGQMKRKLKDREGACDDYVAAMEYGDNSASKEADILCASKLKGKIQIKKETFTMEWPDSSAWKPYDTLKSNFIIQTHFYKAGEGSDKWTEAGAITINNNIRNVPVYEAMKSIVNEQGTPQSQVSLLEKNEEDEFAWIEFVIESPGKSVIYRVVQGNMNQYVVSVTMRTASIDEDTRNAWKEWLNKGKVEYK